MEQVISGVSEFQKVGFTKHKELFSALSTKQEPEVLFLTCADSRIDPSLITGTLPGELFVCRNAGNIVPPYADDSCGMTASIEFAVSVLGVKYIVVCGHSDCGAMKGALAPESLKNLPQVANWLSHCAAAGATVKAQGHAQDDLLMEMTKENVLLQLKHLQTHPAVASKIATGDLELHGWVYDIGTGGISCYQPSLNEFVPLA